MQRKGQEEELHNVPLQNKEAAGERAVATGRRRSPVREEPWQWEEPAGQREEWQQAGQQAFRPGHRANRDKLYCDKQRERGAKL